MEKSLNIILNSKSRTVKLVIKALMVCIMSAFIVVPYRGSANISDKTHSKK